MVIYYFLTFGYSLKTWEESSAIDREVKYINYLSEKYSIKFYIITYGDFEDKKYSKLFLNSEILPIYTFINKSKFKIVNYIKSFCIPFKIKKISNEKIFMIKQNQLLGSWVSILFKLITNKKLFIRTGYDMYQFSIKDEKSKFKQFLYKALTLFSLNFADLYSVSSYSDMNFINDNFPRLIQKVLLIRNWVEVPESINFKDRENIVSIGRLEKQKNYNFLLNEFKDFSGEIILVGKGSEEKYLMDVSSSFKLNLKVIPFISNIEAVNLLSKARYFILPSLYEGNPKVLLEAMAQGCIVLASNIPNHVEIISNTENGFIFELTNNSLSKTFSIVSSKKQEELNKVALSARDLMKKDFSISKIAETEYNHLLGLIDE